MFHYLHLPTAPFVDPHAKGVRLALWSDDCSLTQVKLRAEPNNEEWTVLLTPIMMGSGQLWIGELPLNPASNRNLYCFKLLWETHQAWLSAAGFSVAPPQRQHQFRWLSQQRSPSWMADQVFYQIYPDRFCRGSQSPAPKINQRYHPAYQRYAVPKQWHQPLTEGPRNFDHYGGDLHGVREQLDYLQALGISALSLNPIFTSPSNHRYDPQSYDEVDPLLGGDSALSALTAELRQRDMRIVLDGVFNHTGDNHPWFNRHALHPTTGAYQSIESQFRDFYQFENNAPESYVSWKGHPVLPVLNYSNPTLRELIYAGEHAVVKRWLRPPYQVDGWRLDVAQMIGEHDSARNNLQIVKGITEAIHQTDAQACAIGEHWGDAAEWLQGDCEDACMNYFGFTLPVWAFLLGRDVAGDPIALDAQATAAWQQHTLMQLSPDRQLSQFNLLGGSDTPRWSTLCGDDRRRIAQGVVWLFAHPGTPCIYYGDELTLSGSGDPYNRAPFPWSELAQAQQDPDSIWHLHRRCAALRRHYPALRYGAYQLIHALADSLIFARISENQLVLCAIYRGERDTQLTVCLAPFAHSGQLRPLLSGTDVELSEGLCQLSLQANSAQLWCFEGSLLWQS